MQDKEIIFKYLISTIVYISFALLFWPFKTAILLAGLFAMAMTPLLNRWKKKLKKENVLVFLMVTGLLLMVIAPLTLIITKGILNIAQLQQDSISQLPIYKTIESVVTTVWNFINENASRFNFDLSEFDIQSLLPRMLQIILPFLTTLVTQFPAFLLQLFIFISCLYLFLLKRVQFHTWFNERKLISENSLQRLVKLLQKVCYTVVFSTIVVSSVQALIITIAASISGYDGLLMIFILTFFMAFIPVVGSVPVSLTLAIYSFLQGDVAHGVVMLVALGIAGGIDNVIRAYILSAEEEALHPMVSLITLIGALAMFGISGLFLGPIIAELAFSIGKIMKRDDVPQNAESSAEEQINIPI